MTDQIPGLSRFIKGSGKRLGPLDQALAERMKAIRNLRGITQQDAGDLIGITHQQMQKYESGVNRILAPRLKQLADGYQIDVNMFFESAKDQPQRVDRALDFAPLTVQLAEAFEQIEDDLVRKAVFQLIRAAARSGKRETDHA